MRILSMIAIIAGTATPVFAANNYSSQGHANASAGCQVERAATISFDAPTSGQNTIRSLKPENDR